jgi:membrane protein implicated in regulation of membrane protease activity
VSRLRDHGLSLFFGAIFLLALVGQAVSGLAAYNNDQLTSGGDAVTIWQYVTSSGFGVDVAENWQSEYLQFLLMIVATVWLVQRGSTESKPPDETGLESEREQRIGRYADADSPTWARVGGWRTAVYSNSLALVMGAIFLGSWLSQSVAGHAAYNAQLLADFSDPIPWAGYVSSADFWNRTLQNWQSEFLAVLSMVLLSIYLRQRGSPESKPVGAPHAATAQEG